MAFAAAIYRSRRRQPETDFSMPAERVSGIDGQKPLLTDKPDYGRDGDISTSIWRSSATWRYFDSYSVYISSLKLA